MVEDDPTVREVVATYLRAAGFCVDEAGDGLLALRMVEAAVPDLVILDRLLPGIDGLEVARRMHRIAPVPIIMLTALGSTEDRIAGLEAGVDDYVAKPFSARELVLRVQSVLRRSLAEFAPEVPFDLGEFRLDPNRHVGVAAGHAAARCPAASTSCSPSCSSTPTRSSPASSCCGRCGTGSSANCRR